MRSLILVLALCAGAASAGTWRYELTPGKTYRYAFKSDSRSQVAAPMMGGGVPESRTQIETHYSVKVDRALADGRYDVGLTIEKLVIDDAATGRKVTLTDLPGVARTARALMSRRGKFQFYERPVLQVSANGHYALGVVSASASAVSSEARASNGEEEVRLVTSIDMKTGKMSASVEKSRPQRAKSQEEAPPRKLEVFPVELLALMELPEGPVTPGKTEAMGTGSALQATGVAKAPAACGQAKCGVLELTVASKVDTGGPGRAAAAEQADRTQEGGGEAEMSAPGGMPDGMPGIPGGMPGMPDGMPGMPGGMQPSMAGGAGESETKMSLRATLRFDESAGNLFDVSGSSSSDTSMMGAKITDHSTFTLRSVP